MNKKIDELIINSKVKDIIKVPTNKIMTEENSSEINSISVLSNDFNGFNLLKFYNNYFNKYFIDLKRNYDKLLVENKNLKFNLEKVLIKCTQLGNYK